MKVCYLNLLSLNSYANWNPTLMAGLKMISKDAKKEAKEGISYKFMDILYSYIIFSITR